MPPPTTMCAVAAIQACATMPVMTQTKGMIVRTWSATADAAGAEEYSRYFDGTLLPELRKLPGFNGAYLLRRDLGEDSTIELTAHTFWESAQVIRAFAGDDITVSVVEPEAQAMLLNFDRTATHRCVAVDARD
jgi:heme-degrading monooxygenase HmoA